MNPLLVLHSVGRPATPAVEVTSVNVPSPLFLYRTFGAEAGDVEIEVAVVVEVADGHTSLVGGLSGAAAVDFGLRRDVLERPVLVVVVQHIRCGRSAVDEVQIFEAVVVVVEPGDSGAERLDHHLLGRRPRLVDERDSSSRRHVSEDRRAIGWLGLTCLPGRRQPAGHEKSESNCKRCEQSHFAPPVPFLSCAACSNLRLSSGSGKPSFSARAANSAGLHVLALPQIDIGQVAIDWSNSRIHFQHFAKRNGGRFETSLLKPQQSQLLIEVEFELLLLHER